MDFGGKILRKTKQKVIENRKLFIWKYARAIVNKGQTRNGASFA